MFAIFDPISILKTIGQTGLALIVILGALVFFHELGHFTIAKLFRIKVDEFAFGFGPKWIRLFKRGDTEYTIHPVPLGGFVKLAGTEPGEENVPNGFNSKPVGVRMLVYLAGPLASFLLAYLIFSFMGFTVGLPVGSRNRVDLVEPGSLAYKAGLRTGDIITEINGKKIRSGKQMLDTIHGSANVPLTIIVKRDGREVTIHATPAPREFEKGKVMGALGFHAAPVLKRVGLVESLTYGTRATVAFIGGITQVIFSRDVAKSVGGPIAIADQASVSVKRGLMGFLQLMAILSVSLGIVNLLPIPVMDGGQIMLLFGEAIKGRRLSQRTIELAQSIGLTIIAIMFLLIMYLDLNRVVTGELFR